MKSSTPFYARTLLHIPKIIFFIIIIRRNSNKIKFSTAIFKKKKYFKIFVYSLVNE